MKWSICQRTIAILGSPLDGVEKRVEKGNDVALQHLSAESVFDKMSRVLLQLIAVAIMNAFGQIALKVGADSLGSKPGILFRLPELLNSPYLLAGSVIYFLSLILYIEVLSRIHLSIAYPFIGSTYILVVMISVVLLDEPYNTRIVAGTLLIFVGVSLIGWGMPNK